MCNTVYTLLDYDGYICKAYYAGIKENNAEELLKGMEDIAIEKTMDAFNCRASQIELIRVVSGHTYKKDIYPSYKINRKRDEKLSNFITYVREQLRKNDIYAIKSLEADDTLLILQKYFDHEHARSIILSDDKDLKYYATLSSKLNMDKEIHSADMDDWLSIYAQMLAGDKEDNIKGIPGIGMKTASKMLLESSSKLGMLESVIKIFKQKNIDIDSCLRDILLVSPTCGLYSSSENSDLTLNIAQRVLTRINDDELDREVSNLILSQINSLSTVVKSIYKDDKI